MTPRDALPIDLRLDGLPGAISTWLVEAPEPLLVDPGPATSLETLREGLAALGFSVGDLRHLLLTHVHLDHAGGAGALARENEQLTVHVHEEGAPHMAEPERLVASTRRTFGEAHDRLWGEVVPIPRERIRAWSPAERLPFRHLRALHTPGHAGHHLAYLDERSGTLFAGDSLGIILAEGAPTHPATPPPGLDTRAWERTLDEILAVGPDRAAVAHFGLHGDVPGRVELLRERLLALEARVRHVLAGEGAPGNAEARRGSSDAGADAPQGSASAPQGSASAAQGSADAARGSADAPRGSAAIAHPGADAAREARAEEDRAAYEEEVRAEQSKHRPREEIHRYFDAFSAATDWSGMQRFVERNPPS